MDVDIFPFLNRILANTKSSDCSWEKTGPDAYRLLLRNGSVTVSKGVVSLIPNPLDPDSLYLLRLHDQTGCFYSLDIKDRSSEEYVIVNELFLAIRDEENRIINNKISDLMKEL